MTLALCQDTQAEAYDYPESFFAERVWTPRRVRPDARELAEAARLIAAAQAAADHRGRRRALFGRDRGACGLRGAPRHSGRRDAGRQERAAVTITCSTWARSASPERAPRTRSPRRPTWCSRSARGCRISPPAPGRCSAIRRARIVSLNVQPFDAGKHHAQPLVCDAQGRARGAVGGARRPSRARAPGVLLGEARAGALDRETPPRSRRASNAALPSDAQVIGAVQRAGAALRHRGVRGRRTAGRTAQAVERRRSPAAITSNTAIRAWATRSRAGSASSSPARIAR